MFKVDNTCLMLVKLYTHFDRLLIIYIYMFFFKQTVQFDQLIEMMDNKKKATRLSKRRRTSSVRALSHSHINFLTSNQRLVDDKEIRKSFEILKKKKNIIYKFNFLRCQRFPP